MHLHESHRAGRAGATSPAEVMVNERPLHSGKHRIPHEALGGVTDAHVNCQKHEQAFQPDVRDVLGGDGPIIEPMAMPTNSAPMNRKSMVSLDEHKSENGGDHADKDRQGRSTRHDIHGQGGHGSEKRNVEEAAATPIKRR